MTNDEKMILIEKAIAMLRPNDRESQLAEGWLWISEHGAEIDGQTEKEIVGRLVDHLKYVARRERRRPLDLKGEVPTHDSGIDEIDVMDELSLLEPQDKSIVLLIMAGHSYRSAAAKTGMTPSAIHRAIHRIRNLYASRGHND